MMSTGYHDENVEERFAKLLHQTAKFQDKLPENDADYHQRRDISEFFYCAVRFSYRNLVKRDGFVFKASDSPVLYDVKTKVADEFCENTDIDMHAKMDSVSGIISRLIRHLKKGAVPKGFSSICHQLTTECTGLVLNVLDYSHFSLAELVDFLTY